MKQERKKVSEKAGEHARSFLSALFMGLRTAQIHDTSNKAFENAVLTVEQAANALYAATNGFEIQFVEETVFLNGSRLPFEGSAFSSMRSLRDMLEEKEVGGIAVSTPPTYEAVRTLVLLCSEEVTKQDLEKAMIRPLGIQVFDEHEEIAIDRRVLAVQSYAKLILALREHYERVRQPSSDTAHRLRAVRVIQDLVELCSDRADFVLRLASNKDGASRFELHGVNTCLLSLAMGHALGIGRRDLVDIGVAALFHHIGTAEYLEGPPLMRPEDIKTSLVRLLSESGVGRSSFTRAFIVAQHNLRFMPPSPSSTFKPPHLFSRIVGLAVAVNQLVSGFGTRLQHEVDPLEALTAIFNDHTGHFDPDIVDLLINVQRAFPLGCEVVLETGATAVVASHMGGSRWDRPIVAVQTEPPTHIDLMVKEGDRFVHRIVGTARFLEQQPVEQLPMDAIVEEPTAEELPMDALLGPPPNEDPHMPESVDLMIHDALLADSQAGLPTAEEEYATAESAQHVLEQFLTQEALATSVAPTMDSSDLLPVCPEPLMEDVLEMETEPGTNPLVAPEQPDRPPGILEPPRLNTNAPPEQEFSNHLRQPSQPGVARGSQPSVAPPGFQPGVAPAGSQPSVPTGSQPSVASRAPTGSQADTARGSQPSVAPAGSQPSVAPAGSQPSVPQPSVAPAGSQPSVAPAGSQPSVAPAGSQPSVAPADDELEEGELPSFPTSWPKS